MEAKQKEVEDQKALLRKQAENMNKKNSLSILSQDEELAAMYSEASKIGAENLGGALPMLKVHATGKSSKNELPDGTEPTDGNFFYTPTAEEFESVNVHILTISRGYKAEGIEATADGSKKMVYNQLIGGMLIDGNDYKPFIMYVTGKKLQAMWDFGKEAGKYTRKKPIGIPMFALTVNLSTEKVSNSFGKSWIIKFDLQRNEDGSPVLVMDKGKFQFLKDSVFEMQEQIDSIIAAKATEETEEVPTRVAEVAHEIESEPTVGSPKTTNPEEEVTPDDIPF